MYKVDTVQIHVLSVPGKRRLPHAKVEIRRINTFYLDTIVLADTVEDGTEMGYVPGGL